MLVLMRERKYSNVLKLFEQYYVIEVDGSDGHSLEHGFQSQMANEPFYYRMQKSKFYDR